MTWHLASSSQGSGFGFVSTSCSRERRKKFPNRIKQMIYLVSFPLLDGVQCWVPWNKCESPGPTSTAPPWTHIKWPCIWVKAVFSFQLGDGVLSGRLRDYDAKRVTVASLLSTLYLKDIIFPKLLAPHHYRCKSCFVSLFQPRERRPATTAHLYNYFGDCCTAALSLLSL